MPYVPTAQSFLEQSTLLISARPTTARITTKYKIPHPSPPPHRYKPSLKPERSISPPRLTEPTETTKKRKRAHEEKKLAPKLTLKCYDPASGTCLKYKTDKAAEVGRLVAALGKCGRVMAGLPEQAGDSAKEDPGREGDALEVKEEVKEVVKQEKEGGKQQQQDKGQAGGGKKKKKGKR